MSTTVKNTQWLDIISISVSSHGEFTIHTWILFPVLILTGVVVYFVWVRLRRKFSWEVVEAEVSWAGGKMKIKPDFQDIQIAHKAWVELATRKAGLPFDTENDVIIEIYNSWYALFGELRDLAKQIPAEKVRSSKDTRKLVYLLVEALNQGLRPHLTRWQAKFRRWYEEEVKQNFNSTPQEIQKKYPQYEVLVTDLRDVNIELMNYTEFIRKIAHGKTNTVSNQ